MVSSTFVVVSQTVCIHQDTMTSKEVTFHFDKSGELKKQLSTPLVLFGQAQWAEEAKVGYGHVEE